MTGRRFLAAATLASLFLCGASVPARSGQDVPAPPEYEAISLLGRKLVPPAPDAVALERYQKAKAEFDRNPNEGNTIWYGRRTADLGLFREAVRIYTQGLERFPSSFRLLRHRGHRYVTLRLFDRAVADLKRAAELAAGLPLDPEPDGVPVRARAPLSNTQFNIWYHLGLALYLKGDFAAAVDAYRECPKWCKNDDLLTAATDWLYMALRRMGKADEALSCLKPIRAKMRIIENGAYHRRLLVYKGLAKPESLLEAPAGLNDRERGLNFAVQAYGLGNWYLYNGDAGKARDLFERLVAEGSWPAFGTIAAEAELFRMDAAPAPADRPDPVGSDPVRLLQAWNVMWNARDLSLVERLFLNDRRLSYFSSEKKGLIEGLDGVRAHHAGFGFVPGGRSQENRLWLEDVRIAELQAGQVVLATATWGFDRGEGPEAARRGPATFVIVKTDSGFRIAHAHFAAGPQG